MSFKTENKCRTSRSAWLLFSHYMTKTIAFMWRKRRVGLQHLFCGPLNCVTVWVQQLVPTNLESSWHALCASPTTETARKSRSSCWPCYTPHALLLNTLLLVFARTEKTRVTTNHINSQSHGVGLHWVRNSGFPFGLRRHCLNAFLSEMEKKIPFIPPV